MRRIRGIVVIALLWAFGWAPIGLIAGIIEYRRDGLSDVVGLPMLREDLSQVLGRSTLSWAVVGAITGCVFAIIVSLVERRRSFQDLSWKRFAFAGALSIVALMLLSLVLLTLAFRGGTLSVQVGSLLGFLALGAVSAVATLALGRHSKRQRDAAA